MSRTHTQATIAELGDFDAIIDARSPGEYAEDHIPGAISMPVLIDAERVRVGTLYKQVSAFEAKKVGAALVAKNIAGHIESQLLDKPRGWRPLIYCWRGGQRSGAFSLILREIGWDAHRLQGGYKSWRRHVIDRLDELPANFRFQVVSGATGSAKSRLLEALAERGAQVLHLEELAAHKGSVLGNLPDQEQPTQKGFESKLFSALDAFDPKFPVYVEAESRKIGRVHLPENLITAIRAAPCLRIDATLGARIEFLLRDYDYAIANTDWLLTRLNQLHSLQSRETLAHWEALVTAGQHEQLVRELLELHYDPLYQRSQNHNFTSHTAATAFSTDDLSPAGITRLAENVLATSGETSARVPD